MEKNLESTDMEQLLAEADELIEEINSDAIEYLEDEHRLQFELHMQNLAKIKSQVQEKRAKKEKSEIGTGADGMHKAIEDIVAAMKDLRKKLLKKPSPASQ